MKICKVALMCVPGCQHNDFKHTAVLKITFKVAGLAIHLLTEQAMHGASQQVLTSAPLFVMVKNRVEF